MNEVQTPIEVAVIFLFFRESPKIGSASNIFFRGLNFDFFLSWFFSLVKRKANSTIGQLKCKEHEKREQFQLVSKEQFSFQVSQRNKILTY